MVTLVFFPPLFLQVNAATMQTQPRCCTAWACYQSCCSTCVTPAWLSKRCNSNVASSHHCLMATSHLRTSAGAVRLQMNGKRPPAFSFFFHYNVSFYVQARTLPGLHSPVSGQCEWKQRDVWRWSFYRYLFFTCKSLLHVSQMFWHDPAPPVQSSDPASLIRVRNQLLLLLSKTLDSAALLAKEWVEFQMKTLEALKTNQYLMYVNIWPDNMNYQ